MKIKTSRTLEDPEGGWRRIELEITSADLTEEEKRAPKSNHAYILHIRLEQQMTTMLMNVGVVTPDEAKEKVRRLGELRTSLIPKATLKKPDVS